MKLSYPVLYHVLISSIYSLYVSAQAEQCKTVKALDNFDIAEYTSRKWYSHQQRETPFNSVALFFCISAEYSVLDPDNVPFEPLGIENKFDIKVFNRGKDADGDIFTSDDELAEGGVAVPSPLCAGQAVFQGDKDSQLTVGFCALPVIAFQNSNYWVLAYNEEDGMALIAGGQTDLPNGNGDELCTYSDVQSGLWIFSRSRMRNDTLIEKYRNIARDNGIDPSIMLDVSQVDCEDETPPITAPKNKKAKESKKGKKSKESKSKKAKESKKGKKSKESKSKKASKSNKKGKAF